MNDFVRAIRADSCTINTMNPCAWELPRRVALGSDLGRVVFRGGAPQVNSWLASLWSNYRFEFASAHSNGRVRNEDVPTRPYGC
jgi:hypothetical protein